MLIAGVTTPVPTQVTRPGTVPSRCGPVKTIVTLAMKTAVDVWLECVSVISGLTFLSVHCTRKPCYRRETA